MITNLCITINEDNYYYILIAVAAVAVVIALIAIIISLKRKKKTQDDVVEDNRDLINKNVQAIEPLFVLAEGKDDIIEQLNALQDKLKYLSPCQAKEAAIIDKKIGNALGDIKIELSKTKGEAKSGKAQKYIDEVELLIAERSAYTER